MTQVTFSYILFYRTFVFLAAALSVAGSCLEFFTCIAYLSLLLVRYYLVNGTRGMHALSVDRSTLQESTVLKPHVYRIGFQSTRFVTKPL